MTKFWENVRVSEPDLCWPWLRAVNEQGYGRYFMDEREIGAHRLAYLYYYGQLPKSVMHTCTLPSCCNPQHIVPNSRKVNAPVRKKRVAGVYTPPVAKVGDTLFCEYRKQLVTVSDFRDGWPLMRTGGKGGGILAPIICTEVATMIRTETKQFVQKTLGVSPNWVRTMRRFLGVPV